MAGQVAVIVLTYNEAIHLDRALTSVASFARSLHVIDSGSTDDTLAIAARHGAQILSHPWRNYADQFQWALDAISSSADWVLRLDADEFVSPDLAARIVTELPRVPPGTVGITFDRRHIFLGRWIRHGGRYPLRLLRLARRGHVRIEQRWMDEHLLVEGGDVAHFAGGFVDENLNDLSFFTSKHNGYATREALDVLIARHKLDGPAVLPGGAAGHRRWLKQAVHYRLPFPLAALCYFLLRYILQCGFLDGREGLVYHGLQGLWYRFLVGAKVMEYERALSTCTCRDSKRQRLASLTGLLL